MVPVPVLFHRARDVDLFLTLRFIDIYLPVPSVLSSVYTAQS